MPLSADTRRSPCGLALVLLVCSAACSEESGGGPESVLLITLDTTRADALGTYGGEGSTPRLDQLAEQSIVYANAHTVAPLTLPAHASILSGLYPPRHGLRDNGHAVLPESLTTLAEKAQASGRRTGAFLGAVVLDAAFGLDQGFETYHSPERPKESGTTHYHDRDARAVCDDFLDWHAGIGSEPFFAWVHLFDPHQPYEAPPAWQHGSSNRQAYLAEVSYVDHELGRLFDELERRACWSSTVVALVADHGEGLGDHGETSHATLCYESTLHVPFLIRHPDGRGAGTRPVGLVSVVDVAPTLADALGVAPFPDCDGVSLWVREPPTGRGIYFESYAGYLSFGLSPLAGWIEDGHKYLHSPTPELFALRDDPHERENLFGDDGFDLTRHRTGIARVASDARAASVDESLAELGASLRALGYAGGGPDGEALPHPLERSSLPAPAGMVEHVDRTLTALAHANAGQLDEARRRFGDLLDEHPHNFLALEGLAGLHMRNGQPERAAPYLERLLAQRPRRAGGHHNLGLCRARTGRIDEAIASLWRAAELDPHEWIFMNELMKLLRDEGRMAEANAYVTTWRALRGEAADAPAH